MLRMLVPTRRRSSRVHMQDTALALALSPHHAMLYVYITDINGARFSFSPSFTSLRNKYFEWRPCAASLVRHAHTHTQTSALCVLVHTTCIVYYTAAKVFVCVRAYVYDTSVLCEAARAGARAELFVAVISEILISSMANPTHYAQHPA